MAKKISPDALESELAKVFNEYDAEVMKTTKEEAKHQADLVVDELKNQSPKRTGKYARSWKNTETKKSSVDFEYTVHAGKYQLTHLLEHGHVISNGTRRTYGTTKPIKHIQPVAEKHIKEYEENVIRKVKG